MPIAPQISSQHVTGFVVGLGVAAAGFYFYKKNQKRVDEWLRQQGIALPGAEGSDYQTMTLEELVREKERLEDTIAEREHAAAQEARAAKPRAKRARPASQPPSPQAKPA
jgi:septal ring factor EnvC (AmiA/AmiB activator)